MLIIIRGFSQIIKLKNTCLIRQVFFLLKLFHISVAVITDRI